LIVGGSKEQLAQRANRG